MAETPPHFPTTLALPHLQGPGKGPGQNPARAEEIAWFRRLGWRGPPSCVASLPCTPTAAGSLAGVGPPSPPQAAQLEVGLSQTEEETVTAPGPVQHRRADLALAAPLPRPGMVTPGPK